MNLEKVTPLVWTLLWLIIGCQSIGTLVEGGREAALPGEDDQKNEQNFTPVTSQQLLNSFNLLIVKALNDMENRMEDKLAQLQNVVNDKISLLDSKTKSQFSQFQNGLNTKSDTLDTKTTQFQYVLNSKIDMFTKNFHKKFDALENRIEDRFKSTDETLIYLQVHLTTRKDSLDRKIDDKLGQLHTNLTKESDTCQKNADVKLQTLQSNVDSRIGTLENYINKKLDTLGGRLEDKLDNNSLQLNDKISQKLANYSTDSKIDIINSLDSLIQKSQEEQMTTIGNFSEDFDKNMNKTLRFLARIKISLEVCKKTDEIFDNKNQTRKEHDVLTSNNSTQSQHFYLTSLKNCSRGMAKDAPKQSQRLALIRDNTLDRDILCDTRTDGGGWIVIQRRTTGDVDFYRNWTEHKNGFGTPPGDFWLGNEAIYELTNESACELRIDYNNGTHDLFAVYSSFRLESEEDSYRLRLGSHSGTLGECHEDGLSYSNGMTFSTYDRDNAAKCAKMMRGGWWHKFCHGSNLNGPWEDNTIRRWSWWTGSVWYNASSTEMKIRIK